MTITRINRTVRLHVLLIAAALPADRMAAAADEPANGRLIIPLNGKNLDGWKLKGTEAKSRWVVGEARLDPDNSRRLIVASVTGSAGELINSEPHGVDIYTAEKFGDATINLEFMVPEGSNSGVYVMGEYEVQILDSYGREKLTSGDLGSLYGASPPRVNAAKKPGQWQQMLIEFEAPKFNRGKKVANARFKRVVINGQVVQEDVEMPGPTPGGVRGKEAPHGPLMFQGDHGPVAYRHIKIMDRQQNDPDQPQQER